MKSALILAVRQSRVQGRRVLLVGLRDELAAIGDEDLLRRFGLTEVERVAFPNNGNSSLAADKGLTTSLDRALVVARDCGAQEIVLALRWDDSRVIELVRDWLRASPLPVQLLPDQKVRYLTQNPAFSVNRSLAVEIQRAPLSGLELIRKARAGYYGRVRWSGAAVATDAGDGSRDQTRNPRTGVISAATQRLQCKTVLDFQVSYDDRDGRRRQRHPGDAT